MLAHLEERIQSLTVLSKTDREKSVKRLEAAQVEAQESEPNKDSIANSLKRVNNTLKEAECAEILVLSETCVSKLELLR